MNPGLIFDIKRYSINDGPGIRITIFFKGCPLACAWCHNPESQSGKVQKLYSANKCIGCNSCVDACPENALHLDPEKGIITDFEKCNLCGSCARVCPTHAMELCGQVMTTGQVMQEILRETLVMDTSGGGVTFSGGEPLMHPEQLIELLKRCGSEGIHRAVDTSGFASPETLLRVAQHTDLFLYDLKHMDSAIHKQYTGVGNERILQNLVLLSENGKRVQIRIPLVEGVNADEEHLHAMAAFISSLPGETPPVHVLPYHAIAERKYEKLGGVYSHGNMREPDNQKLELCRLIFSGYNLELIIGG